MAVFGTKDRLRCETHALEGDFNLVERKCISCGLMNLLDKNSTCSLCNPTTFQQVNQRSEMKIRDLLLGNNIKFIQDKIPNGTICGKERPDFVIVSETHMVIVEVDEFQHKSYQCLCEQTRMINITQTFGGLPVFWIRYNPDSFIMPNKQKSSISQLKRELHLLDWIHWSMKTVPTNLAEVIYLFYDGCKDKQSIDQISILPTI